MANHGLDHGLWLNHNFQKRVAMLLNCFLFDTVLASLNTKLLPGQSLYATGHVYASAPVQRSVLIFLFIPGHVPPSVSPSLPSLRPPTRLPDHRPPTTKRQLLRGRDLPNSDLPFLTLSDYVHPPNGMSVERERIGSLSVRLCRLC